MAATAKKASVRPTQAAAFKHAREARANAMLEDCTELIAELIAGAGEARLTDIARRLGVAHPTASKTLQRLKREGLVAAQPYRGFSLTAEGSAMAERAKARHRLVAAFLVAIGVPSAAAEADAEGIEHYVSKATLKAFERFLATR